MRCVYRVGWSYVGRERPPTHPHHNTRDPHTHIHNRDQASKGIRVFSFATKGVLGTLYSIYETARLFEPVLTQGVSAAAAARNAEFLRDYAGGCICGVNESNRADGGGVFIYVA